MKINSFLQNEDKITKFLNIIIILILHFQNILIYIDFNILKYIKILFNISK